MGGGGINTSATRLEALNIQSSTAGAVIPWLRGQHRIPGNLVWYGDFRATAHTQQQGGKGGGGTSTSYTYSASLVMGLCHGTIAGVANVWKGKGTSSVAGLGLTVQTGAVGQAMWSGLAGRGVQALNYSGLATVAALNYQLGDSASVENHSFEVQHVSAYSVHGGSPDVDPRQAAYELLTHSHQGAGFPAVLIGDWSDWSNYCIANKLLISPLLTTQTSARDALQTMADLTNTGIVWSDGKLKMRPYGDAAAAAYGYTYTPDTTPVYELDDNCYIKSGDEAPVKRSLKSAADRKNIVKVQYRDRANGYNPAVVDAKDLTDISANGARPLDMIEADWICVGEVARFVAEIRKQRELLVVGEYTFRLPWHYALIECMDLLTISDSVLMLDDVPVRVKQIVEESDEELAFTCEDFPAGVASAPLYASQGMTGFALDANVSPGDALPPVIFEMPGALTTTGLELAIATGSTNPNWGGCQVWVSYDGATYRQLAELRGSSRYGVTQLDTGASLQLFTSAGQQLLSGSAADATSLATLIYVAPAGAVAGEYLAYETATLTAANAYTLGGLVRGAYGSTQVVHGGATPWVRVDDAIARSGPLDPALIGKTVHIKLTSFNVFGGAQQSQADVAAVEYTVSGRHYVRGRPSSTLGIKLNVNDFAGTPNFSEAYIHGRDASGAAVDAPGSILVNGVAVAVPNGQLNTNFGPAAGYLLWDSAGATFSALGTQTRPYVMARRHRGQWQYDDNNGGDWVNITPTPTMYVIGTLETGAPDAGNPGGAPGIVVASLYAAAVSPQQVAWDELAGRPSDEELLNSALLPVIGAAQAAAEAYALAKANLAEVTARAYADGIVDAEEARAIADAQAKANAAQAAAIAAAQADATAKANAAQAAAQAYAVAQANAADVSARAYADGIVDAEEARAIADAEAKAVAARDAAIAAAAADAEAKATAARLAAEAYALARANAADAAARAYADGIVDAEEARAIADADAKASAAQAAAVAAASADASTKAGLAQSAAQTYALAQAGAADASARAYADGIVDAEEARASADADAKASAARIAAEAAAAADATAKSNLAALTATWAGVSGAGKPADNATVGATFGVNISGQAGTGDIAATAITELASASGSVAYSNIA